LVVYAIGLKTYYYSASTGDYIPFASSVLKSKMHIAHVTVPFQNGVYVTANMPMIMQDGFTLYSSLCSGIRLSWPQGQSGLLVTSLYPPNIEHASVKGKDHGITTLGGTIEAFILYIENRNPINPTHALIDIGTTSIENPEPWWGIPVTNHHQTISQTVSTNPVYNGTGFLLGSLAGEVTYNGYGRMLYALYPVDGFTARLSSKDHLESDISGEMRIDINTIRPTSY
jgi:hypothetical protein